MTSTASNMPSLSRRAALALDILADGGSLAYRLERNSYTGRDQFQVRLRAADGSVVKGVGVNALHELTGANMIRTSPASTSSCTLYKLAVD